MFAEFVGEIFCGAVGGMGGPRCAGTRGEGGLHVCKSVRLRKHSLELVEPDLIFSKLRHQLIETRVDQESRPIVRVVVVDILISNDYSVYQPPRPK
jgi:hypothetical protein